MLIKYKKKIPGPRTMPGLRGSCLFCLMGSPPLAVRRKPTQRYAPVVHGWRRRRHRSRCAHQTGVVLRHVSDVIAVSARSNDKPATPPTSKLLLPGTPRASTDEQRCQWVSGSRVTGQVGQQIGMGHVGHGSVLVTHDFVFFRHRRDLQHSLSHDVSLIQLFLRSILW